MLKLSSSINQTGVCPESSSLDRAQAVGYYKIMKRKIRSKHNNLLNYFIHDEKDLSPAYARKCEEFIDSLGSSKLADCFKMEKPQAASDKPQATSATKKTQS